MATEQVVLALAAKQPGMAKVSGLSRFLNKYFYFSMSLLIAAVVMYGFTGCGKTPNVWRKGEICGMENNQSSLADRSWGILARSFFHPFREIEFFRSLFSHTVNDNLIHATPPRPWILWVHGAVFSGWLAFFIFQSALVRTHHVKLHRLTGWFGAGLGVLIPVLGISTAIIMNRFRAIQLHVAGLYPFFSVQALDVISFTILFWLAIY